MRSSATWQWRRLQKVGVGNDRCPMLSTMWPLAGPLCRDIWRSFPFAQCWPTGVLTNWDVTRTSIRAGPRTWCQTGHRPWSAQPDWRQCACVRWSFATQYAACAHLAADLCPKRHICMGSLAARSASLTTSSVQGLRREVSSLCSPCPHHVPVRNALKTLEAGLSKCGSRGTLRSGAKSVMRTASLARVGLLPTGVVPLPTVSPSGASQTRCCSTVCHFDPVQPSHLICQRVDVIRKGATSVPNSCFPLVQLNACASCVPHQCFCQKVERRPHPVRFAQEVDVVSERVQGTLRLPLTLTLLRARPEYQLKNSPFYESNHCPPMSCVIEPIVRRGLEIHSITNGIRAFASSICRSLFNIAIVTRRRRLQSRQRPRPWRADLHPWSLRANARHNRCQRGQESVLEWRTFLLELLHKLLWQRPCDKSAKRAPCCNVPDSSIFPRPRCRSAEHHLDNVGFIQQHFQKIVSALPWTWRLSTRGCVETLHEGISVVHQGWLWHESADVLWQLQLKLLKSLFLQVVERFIVTGSESRSSETLTGSRDFTKLRFLACCFVPVPNVPNASRCRSVPRKRCNCFVNEWLSRASAEQIEGSAQIFQVSWVPIWPKGPMRNRSDHITRSKGGALTRWPRDSPSKSSTTVVRAQHSTFCEQQQKGTDIALNCCGWYKHAIRLRESQSQGSRWQEERLWWLYGTQCRTWWGLGESTPARICQSRSIDKGSRGPSRMDISAAECERLLTSVAITDPRVAALRTSYVHVTLQVCQQGFARSPLHKFALQGPACLTSLPRAAGRSSMTWIFELCALKDSPRCRAARNASEEGCVRRAARHLRKTLEARRDAANSEDELMGERSWKLFCWLLFLLLHRPESKFSAEWESGASTSIRWLTSLHPRLRDVLETPRPDASLCEGGLSWAPSHLLSMRTLGTFSSSDALVKNSEPALSSLAARGTNPPRDTPSTWLLEVLVKCLQEAILPAATVAGVGVCHCHVHNLHGC